MRRLSCGAALLLLTMRAAAADEPSPVASPPVEPAAAAPADAVPAGAEPSSQAPGGWDLLRTLGMESWTDVFHFGNWHSIFDVRGDGNMQTTRSPNSPDADYSSRLTSQGVSIRNQGFVLLDPRLFTGSFGARFALQQGAQDTTGESTAQNIDVTDWFVDTALLQSQPYNLNFGAAHTKVITSLVGGGSTTTENDSRLATFNWSENTFLRDREIMPYFSAVLQAGSQHLRAITNSAGQVFRQNEKRDLLRLNGHDGLENGDLYFDFENTDLTNYAYPDGSFRSRYANVNLDIDFGEYLDRHSTTVLNYNDRDSQFTVSSLNVNQNLEIDHTDFLSSNYSYSYLNVDSPFGTSNANTASAGVQYSPYLNLTTNAGAIAGRETFDEGYIQTVGGDAGVSYFHDIAGDGQLSTSLNGGVNYNKSELESGQIPAIDQPYVAPPELGAGAGFVLKDPYVVTDSIIVVDVSGGSRVLTQVGVDYEVLVDGSRTTIVPLPTSAIIQPGDPLQVSYLHLVDPSAESMTITSSAYLLLNWSWIGASYTHTETRQKPLSGQELTLVYDAARDSLQLDLRGQWDKIRAWGGGSVLRYRATNLDYDQLRVVCNLSYRPNYTWLFVLTSTVSDTNYLTTGRESRQNSVRVDGSWSSQTGWWANGFIAYRTLVDTDAATETVTEAIIQVRRNWTKLDFSASIGVGERTRGDMQTRYGTVNLAVVRQF